jgi:hypothetical protein
VDGDRTVTVDVAGCAAFGPSAAQADIDQRDELGDGHRAVAVAVADARRTRGASRQQDERGEREAASDHPADCAGSTPFGQRGWVEGRCDGSEVRGLCPSRQSAISVQPSATVVT